MTSGMRPPLEYPAEHGRYRLWRTHGVFYAIPADLAEELTDANRLAGHPEVLSALTLDELRERIDAAAPVERPGPPAPEADDGRRPVEFAGWLPIFEVFGNCGRHPQFGHTKTPPPGYRFTNSEPTRPLTRPKPPGRWLDALLAPLRTLMTLLGAAPEVGWGARLQTFWAAARLFFRARAAGCSTAAAVKFLHSRHLTSQLMLTGRIDGLTFLTSIPYTYNQTPWVIEIEDVTTLFFPFIHNGETSNVDFRASPMFPAVKALLESDECKGVVTHMRSTADMVAALFRSEAIARKVFYAPMGLPLPSRCQRHAPRPAGEPIDLLFINSWTQGTTNFCLRGGIDVLEAFRVLRGRYPNLRLTMRSALPPLDPHYHRIIESHGVRVVGRFVSSEEMAELHAASDIFLLPAARIHIVSLLQAMGHGLAVVASDGWGFEEYVDDGRNGLVVRGRYGKTSWSDPEAGVLREDYASLFTPDPVIVAGIVEAVSRLVEDPALRARLGAAARADVEKMYTLDRWNEALKDVFDAATGRTGPALLAEPRRERLAQRVAE